MKVALIGLGHLGKIHFKCLKETDFELVGIYDPKFSGVYEGTACYNEVGKLISEVDACIIAAATSAHQNLTEQALSQGKHCFVEKPLASTLEETHKLVQLASKFPELITQVGFVERYNPAFQFLENEIRDPKFIEVHRLAQFNNRGIDVSVVHDLMIHDLDLLLTMKKSKIREVKANGVKVFTDTLDICNSRIEFDDGSVANITASRMSMKVMRKFRIFQDNCYLSMDLQKKESQIIKLSNEQLQDSMQFSIHNQDKFIQFKSSGVLEGNAIAAELNDFYSCIQNGIQTRASFENVLHTSRLAHEIETIANNSLN